jgi:hypothetical protein
MTDTTNVPAPIPLGAIPQKRGWIKPPWAPGQSGNPSGLAKDGGGSKDHPIRATLRKRLAKRRALQRFVDAWIEDACTGDSAAREQILKRLDPVVEDPSAGRTVLEGLRLELTHRGVTMTAVRAGQASELREIEDTGVPEGGHDDPQIGLAAPDLRLEPLQIAHQESQESPQAPRESQILLEGQKD